MVVRIAGVTLPANKQISTALTYIFGVGIPSANKILAETRVDPGKRTQELSEDEVQRLRALLEHEDRKIEGELRRDVSANIRRLKEVGSYRGTRHAKKLPARGQRTKTNSRTVRGNVRKTMGSGRKPASQKT